VNIELKKEKEEDEVEINVLFQYLPDGTDVNLEETYLQHFMNTKQDNHNSLGKMLHM
jgi:hypothetical protein